MSQPVKIKKNKFWEKQIWSFNPLNSTCMQNSTLYSFCYEMWAHLELIGHKAIRKISSRNGTLT